MTDSDVETGLDAYIGNRRLRMDLELATATRGRVQLVSSISTLQQFLKLHFITQISIPMNFMTVGIFYFANKLLQNFRQ
jgi:hypothetical protein